MMAIKQAIEAYEVRGFKIRHILLRGIVNHSYGKSQIDSDRNKSQMDNSERNIEDNRLSVMRYWKIMMR